MLGGFMPFFIKVLFLVVGAIMLTKVAAGTAQYLKNNKSPVETHTVTAVAKRTKASQMAGTPDMPPMATTDYYVTFEFSDGSRREFHMKGRLYGLVAEGDTGNLTFQGTRFLEFNRQGVTEHE